MKDTTKLLNFNPNRSLQFDPNRSVDIELRRGLMFDTDRDLSFDFQRTLPFGDHGVSFRHFACGNCGAVVDGSAPQCPKCRAWFISEKTQIESDTRVTLSEDVDHSSMTKHFGSEYQEQPARLTREPPRYRCNACGNSLRYIQSRRKWYCDRCRLYIGTSQQGQPRTPRQYVPQGGSAGGVKFTTSQGGRQRHPGEVVIVEDINRRRRMR